MVLVYGPVWFLVDSLIAGCHLLVLSDGCAVCCVVGVFCVVCIVVGLLLSLLLVRLLFLMVVVCPLIALCFGIFGHCHRLLWDFREKSRIQVHTPDHTPDHRVKQHFLPFCRQVCI